MSDIEYLIKLPPSDEIMVAQSGEQKGSYKLTEMNLEFESIEGANISRDTAQGFERGRNVHFSANKYIESEDWSKIDTSRNIKINIPLRHPPCSKKKETRTANTLSTLTSKAPKLRSKVGLANSITTMGLEKVTSTKRLFGSLET